jgi:hypothetical protein
MPLSTDDLTFLARLAKSPDGLYLVTMLEARLGHVEGMLRRLEGVQMHRAQGRAETLDELISDIREAHTKLTRNLPTVSPRFRKVVSMSGNAA